jgi:histone deacetylase complex regulatory component SIN3
LQPTEALIKVAILAQVPQSKRVRILLMSKDDTTLEDPVNEQERWQAYTDSFALVSVVKGSNHLPYFSL